MRFPGRRGHDSVDHAARKGGTVTTAIIGVGNIGSTLARDSFASSANREPRRAVLFYATDDDAAATTIERLIHAAGFDPLKVGGVGAARRIEMPGGDLHQFGLNGKILDLEEARSTVAAAEVQA